jgi:hypothetical protein
MPDKERGKGEKPYLGQTVKKTKEYELFGKTLLKIRTEEQKFDIDRLPQPIKNAFKKSQIPKELYGDVYAFMGYAYGNARVSLGSELVSDNPEQRVLVAREENFNETRQRIIEGVEVNEKKLIVTQDEIKGLMKDVFASVNASPNIVEAVDRQIEIIYEQYDRELKKDSSREIRGTW